MFFLLYVGVELGFAGWIFTYGEEMGIGGARGPALLTALFWIGFTGGRLLGNYEYSKARFEEALALYQKSVQDAFRDVSDSLIAYQRLRELRAQVEELTAAYRLAADLANTRYEGGVTSYLEVL